MERKGFPPFVSHSRSLIIVCFLRVSGRYITGDAHRSSPHRGLALIWKLADGPGSISAAATAALSIPAAATVPPDPPVPACTTTAAIPSLSATSSTGKFYSFH